MLSPPSQMLLYSRGTHLLLQNTFGAFLLSMFIALILYGLILAQTVRYVRVYPSDRPLLKILVLAIFISDTLHSACNIHICYHYLVTEYFSPTKLFINIWSINVYPLLLGMTAILTQGFYTRRIYLVPGAEWKYRLLVVFIGLLMSVEFGLITASSIVSFRSSTFTVLSPTSAWMNSLNLAIATVVDLVLTGVFVTVMRQKRTGFSRTDAVLNRLARYAVFATGLVSALAIPAFICSVVLSPSFVYIAIASPASKVYANSVFAVLNCKKSLPPPGNATDDMEGENIKLSDLRGRWNLSPQSADGGM